MKPPLSPRSALSLLALTLGTALTVAPSVARADAVSDAKDLFTRGREMRARGDCAGAAPLFRKAFELFPDGLGSVRNLAECEESLGHYASSRRAWLDLRRALLTNDDKKYEGWQKDADDAAARLAPKLATITIDLGVVDAGGQAAPPRGVEVKLDGEVLATSLVGTALERDPGRHVVQVGGPGVKEPVERAIDLVAGDAKRIPLRVVVATDGEASDGGSLPSTPPTDGSADHARSARRTAAWIALGTGAASLAGMGISIGVRQSALSTINSQCPDHSGCSTGLQSTESRGQAASTAATVLGIVGAVGVVSGVVLYATSKPRSGQTGLVVTPTLGGASASWSF
jgi:hypothetical protein